MTTNPPRAIVPLQDCKQCYGSGVYASGWEGVPFSHDITAVYAFCECVLDQLTSDNEPFTVDTTPNDLTRGVDVKEG